MPDAGLSRWIRPIEAAMDAALPAGGQVAACMRYAALGGGKRIRPALLLEFHTLFGGNAEDAMPFALALEMIHTYSLIHDDLPCMDDDDTRRGRPACHIAYPEAIALLAGDALLTRAFEIAAACPLPADRVLHAMALLARGAGTGGMIGGQEMDLAAEGRRMPVSYVEQTDQKKTGALLRLCGSVPAALLGISGERAAAADTYCGAIGLLFQITDDLLDLEGDPAQTGKPVGSDERAGKSTYPAAAGVDGARAEADRLARCAQTAAEQLGSGALRVLASELLRRRR